MGTPNSGINETKKNLKDAQEAALRLKNKHGHAPFGKKESLQPDLKQEYEMLERYLQNFSGSSF